VVEDGLGALKVHAHADAVGVDRVSERAVLALQARDGEDAVPLLVSHRLEDGGVTLDGAGVRQNAEQDMGVDADEVALDVADWDDVEELQAPEAPRQLCCLSPLAV
jgi:hypothetical protein